MGLGEVDIIGTGGKASIRGAAALHLSQDKMRCYPEAEECFAEHGACSRYKQILWKGGLIE